MIEKFELPREEQNGLHYIPYGHDIRINNDKRIYVCMNHTLSPDQDKDLIQMGYKSVQLPSDGVKKLTSQIPVSAEKDYFWKVAERILEEVLENKCHAIFVTGQAWIVACVHQVVKEYSETVPFGLFMLDAVSERVSQETINPDGTTTKTNVFCHRRFRIMY